MHQPFQNKTFKLFEIVILEISQDHLKAPENFIDTGVIKLNKIKWNKEQSKTWKKILPILI